MCCGEPDSAPNGMDQHVFAGFESCLPKGVVCGYENFGNGARRGPLEVRWHRDQCILMCRHEFRMGSATDNPHNAIPKPNLAPGLAAIEKAAAMGAKTERERGYIDALRLMYADYDKLSHVQRIRLFRDAQTVRHHGFHSESRYETVGQVYLGVDPEFPFVAF